MTNVIPFPRRKRIQPVTLRITDQHMLDIQFKEQTEEEILAEILRDEREDEIRRVLRQEGLIE